MNDRAAKLVLLVLFAACASAPPESLQREGHAQRIASGLRCESVIASQEIQVPLTGNLADVRLTLRDLPETLGELRVLVRQPRFPASLELEGAPQPFDRVLPMSPERELTVVLTRPRSADDDWPRDSCKACRVELELTGLFGARDGMRQFFARAMQDVAAVEGAFSRQSGEPVRGTDLREMAESLIAEAKRCGVAIDAPLLAVNTALDKLDEARLHFYAQPAAELPDAIGVNRAFEAAARAIESQLFAAEAAREFNWPSSLRHAPSKLRWASLHLELAAQAALLPPVDRALAAPWIAFALAPDAAALDRRATTLPRIQSLADAEARLSWVDARYGALPLPGASRPSFLRFRELRASRHGKPCIGPGGAAPAREGDAIVVAQFLGADASGRLPISRPDDVPPARETLHRSSELLCNAPTPDLTPLFARLAEQPLSAVSAQLEALLRETRAEPDDSIARDVNDHAQKLICALFDRSTLERRAGTLAGYKAFVEGGADVLSLVPDPLMCGSAADLKQRLREVYRVALERHATASCPQRGGKCPSAVAEAVQRAFSLRPPELARPASGRALDFPPPFGFSDSWVKRLNRCDRSACAELASLRESALSGQFEGLSCGPMPDESAPQTVTLEIAGQPSSISLSSCNDAAIRVYVRAPGPLISIASPQPFRFGNASVNRKDRHPQLGRVYAQVATLGESGEVLLTPSAENQTFYFIGLRRRDE
jgi:hypothetical protein